MNNPMIIRRTCVAAILLVFALPAWPEDEPSIPNAGLAVTERVGSGGETAAAEPVATTTTPSFATSLPPNSSTTNESDKWRFALYPVLGWAPIFRANTDFSLPNGGQGINGAGSTNWGINGAALFGLDVTKKGWLFEGEGMWASVSGSRQNPYVNVSTSVDYGDGFIGHTIWKGISLLAGFRRMAVDVSTTIGELPTFSRKPGVWDPLVGLDWRKKFGRKIFVQIRADGGGFGVGSDVDTDVEARLEWRFAKHFGILGGYEALHYQISGAIKETIGAMTVSHPWQFRQTFNGPLMGFGIYF